MSHAAASVPCMYVVQGIAVLSKLKYALGQEVHVCSPLGLYHSWMHRLSDSLAPSNGRCLGRPAIATWSDHITLTVAICSTPVAVPDSS